MGNTHSKCTLQTTVLVLFHQSSSVVSYSRPVVISLYPALLQVFLVMLVDILSLTNKRLSKKYIPLPRRVV